MINYQSKKIYILIFWALNKGNYCGLDDGGDWTYYKDNEVLCCKEKKYEDSTCGVLQYTKGTRVLGATKER